MKSLNQYINESKESSHTQNFKKKYGKDFDELPDSMDFTAKVAKVTGIKKSILDEVYKRGIGAAKTSGTRASVDSDDQWAKSRVYSFVTKASGTWGGSDKDLAEKVK